MDDLTLINNTSVYRNPSPDSPLQGPGVMQPAVYYSKLLLRTIELEEADYEFDKLAIEKTMPANNGANEITFKRMKSLAAHTQPLVEGIPPASDQGRMEAIKAGFKQYGRVMKFTDKVEWAVVDPLISEYTRQLALKVPETKDILAQEALLAESNVFYAQAKKSQSLDTDRYIVDAEAAPVTHITHLHPGCNPTVDEFRQIVLSMEAAKVRPHMGGNFLALVSSSVMFDLITDKRVKEYMRYAGTGEAYKNDAVIDLFSLVFRKNKTIKSDNTFIDAEGAVKYLYFAASEVTGYVASTGGEAIKTSKGFTVALSSDKLDTITTEEAVLIDAATGLELAYKSQDGESSKAEKFTVADLIKDTDILPLNVHHSFVLGDPNECLYRIGVEGHTTPQFIKKELGSSGVNDPLNQRQSIGWKLDSLGYKVVRPDAVVDYMSIPSQYKVNMNPRPDTKHQFTDYWYGYTSADGKYWHPEQVMPSFDSASQTWKYFVRGTNIEAFPVKMTKLVKPINGGRILATGKKPVVVGNIPTVQFALVSNKEVRFVKEQVMKSAKDNKYYIKGLEGEASAEVVKLPVIDGDKIIEPNPNQNATGDPRIDDAE